MNLKKMPVAGVYIDPTKVVYLSKSRCGGLDCIQILFVNGSKQDFALFETAVEDWFEALSQPNPNGRL